jgi:hypothetical protein
MNAIRASQNNSGKRKRGRPAIGRGTPVTVRLRPAELERVDGIAATLSISRPEALRRLLRKEDR